MSVQHRSARRFGRPSPLFRWAREQGLLEPRPNHNAIVLGAGLLLEATLLADAGWRVDALETPTSVERRPGLYSHFARRPGCRIFVDQEELGGPYGLGLITHVLEFIEEPGLRVELASSIARRLDPTCGRLLVSLRGWSDVRAAKQQTPRGDGIVTGLGTWARGFSVDEAKTLLEAAGLTVVSTPNPRSRAPEQVRLVCRPTLNATR